MNEDALHAFVAVAEHRHFGRAAAAGYVVVSTLSRRVTALERSAGLLLVDRTPGSVRLTRQGEAFLPVVRSLLAEMDAAKVAARRIRVSERSGHCGQRLSVGVPGRAAAARTARGAAAD